jgi:hypothetical protein
MATDCGSGGEGCCRDCRDWRSSAHYCVVSERSGPVKPGRHHALSARSSNGRHGPTRAAPPFEVVENVQVSPNPEIPSPIFDVGEARAAQVNDELASVAIGNLFLTGMMAAPFVHIAAKSASKKKDPNF